MTPNLLFYTMTIQRLQQHFAAHISTLEQTLAHCNEKILQAANLLKQCLAMQGKILLCGNGGSATDAQHFASELVNRFEINRKGLAGIALTTDNAAITSIANDMHFNEIFARQIEALAQPQDVLITITTSGNSANIIRAVETANALSLPVIALTGKNGGKLRPILSENTIEICIPSNSTARIQEAHILIIHCLCDIIDFEE